MVNVDASFNPENLTSEIGAVIRDDNRRFVASCNDLVQYVIDPSGGPKIFIKHGRIICPSKFLSKYLSNFYQNRLRRRPEAWAHARA
jgi:hypothetical protein